MKRGIAGSMVFHVFNREPLLARLKDSHLFLANRYSLQEAALFSKVYDLGLQSGLLRTSSFVDTTIGSADSNFGPIAITIDKVLASPWYNKHATSFRNKRKTTQLATVKPHVGNTVAL